MYYSEMVKRASHISMAAHKDDLDKGGYPYVFHPYHLAMQMEDEMSCVVALLHDVIEDHGDQYSFEELQKIFPKEVIDALKVLTHEDTVPYMEYVKEIGNNKIAREVKMADLRHNMDIRRMNGVKTPKYKLYQEALEYLEMVMEYEKE